MTRAETGARPTGVKGCHLVDIRSFVDGRGGLAFIEGQTETQTEAQTDAKTDAQDGSNATAADLPFPIRRVYYAWGMDAEAVRGEHAHRALEQIYIALNGRFDVILEDGVETRTVTLDRPDQGLYLGHMVWRRLENFSPGAICLVLASAAFDEADYFRDKATFLRAVTQED